MIRHWLVAVAISAVAFVAVGLATAHNFLADAPANAKWHAPDQSTSITFLGKDTKETAVLVLKKSVVLGSIISIESDATNISIRSGDAPQVSFATSAGANGVITRISAGSGESPLLFNNAEQPRFRGKWIQIVLVKDDTLTIQLEATTFATIKFEHLSLQRSSPAAPVVEPSTKPIAKEVETAGTVHAFLERAKKSVFQIQILDAQKQPFAGGTGFVVTDDGFAVTCFHVVQGGSGALAIFDDKRKPIPIELWCVQPEYDLALIHLPPPEDQSKYEPLAIATATSGDNVWALGYPLQVGYTVNKGVVSGIRVFADLPSEMRSVFSYAADSQWIQTDCTINHGNSGGPLINEKAEVLGVNTWFWPKGQNVYFCLSASHFARLIQHQTDSAITFAGAGPQFAKVRTPWSQIPRLPIVKQTPPTFTPAQLNAITIAFANGVSKKCPRCEGTGRITIRVQTGTHVEGVFRVPDFMNQETTCDRCQGKGFERVNDEVLNSLAARFLKTLAGIKRSDPESTGAIGKAYRMITDSMIGDYKTWLMLTANGRSVLSQKFPLLGTPVIAKVAVLQSFPVQEGQRAFLVQVAGTDQLAYVIDPVSADMVDSGPALMGGLIEIGMLADKEQGIAVLKNGFLVAPPVNEEWWWWFGERKSARLEQPIPIFAPPRLPGR